MIIPKKALSSEELIKLFNDRGMQVTDEDLDKIKHINYYKLKEFAHPLSKITKTKGEVCISYEGVTFQDVLRRYYQDKNLRIFLLHAIEKIEVSIKTNFSHVMGLKYGGFGYLDFSKWAHHEKYTRYEIEKKQYRLKKNILNSMGKQRSSEFRTANNLDKDGFPTIWLAIDAVTFGDIVIMLDMMNDTVLRKISAEYNATSEEFLSWIKCLHFIRNICAHNSNLIDVKLKTKPKYRREWVSLVYLVPSKDGKHNNPTNRLAAVICIVVYLVKSINARYQLKNIQNSINSLCYNCEDRAQLLGFNSLSDAKKICGFIK